MKNISSKQVSNGKLGIVNVSSLLERAFMFLEDYNFINANKYAEKVLDVEPKNADAYLVKLLAENKLAVKENLKTLDNSFSQSENYKKIVKFGTEKLKEELKGYLKIVEYNVEQKRKNVIYNEALSQIKVNNKNSLNLAIDLLNSIIDHRDSQDQIKICQKKISDIELQEQIALSEKTYTEANKCLESANDKIPLYQKALSLYLSIANYKDSAKKIDLCNKKTQEIVKERYDKAILLMNSKDAYSLNGALDIFNQIKEYTDCKDKIEQCNNELENLYLRSYNEAKSLMEKKDLASLKNAKNIFLTITKYKDSKELLAQCEWLIQQLAKEEQEEKNRKIKQERDAKRKRKKIIKIVIAITLVIIIALSVVIVKACNKRKNEKKYGVSNFVVQVVEKTNVGQQNGYLITKVKLYITNNCKVGFDALKGSIIFSNANNNSQLWKGDMSLTGDVEANGDTGIWNLEIKDEDDSLWNVPLEGMNIQLKITSVNFKDYVYKEYDVPYKTIYKGNASWHEVSYQKALNLFNAGNYNKAKELFDCLASYKDSEQYATVCEDKIFCINMENSLYEVAGSSAILPDNYDIYASYSQNQTFYYQSYSYSAFYCDLTVTQEQKNTYLTNFKNKLHYNGFVQVDDNIYKKNSTMISFSNVKEGYVGNYIDYYAWKV